MMLLNYSKKKDSFSLESIKNKLCNKIFGIKLYDDGSSYSGYLEETKNEILSYAIYKDSEGRRLMGKDLI